MRGKNILLHMLQEDEGKNTLALIVKAKLVLTMWL